MKGKKPTGEQRRWLQDFGIKNTDPYLVQKITATATTVIDTRTDTIIKFTKVVSRRSVTLERIPTDAKGKELIV